MAAAASMRRPSFGVFDIIVTVKGTRTQATRVGELLQQAIEEGVPELRDPPGVVDLHTITRRRTS